MSDPSVRRVPATVGQRLLWFLDRRRSGSLNCPMICRVNGKIDENALCAAVDRLSTRHESLRTTFSGKGRELTQLIHDPQPLRASRIDISTTSDPETSLRHDLAREVRTPVQVGTWPLRVSLWRLGNESHVLCMNIHHLVTDTWSCSILFRELAHAYGTELGLAPPLPPSGWQYAQFAAWQNGRLQRGRLNRQREYWAGQLSGMEPPPLPLRPSPLEGGTRCSTTAEVPADVVRRLRSIAHASQTTLFSVMLSVYFALLHVTTEQYDLAVGSLFANRTRPEVEGTVGFLANLLVLRTRLGRSPSFLDVVHRTRSTAIAASAHQELPFHLVAHATEYRRTVRADQIVFQMLAEPIDTTIRIGDVEFQGLVPDLPGRFDFELGLMPRTDGTLAARLHYTSECIPPSWAGGFLSACISAAAAAARSPTARLTDLPIEHPPGEVAQISTSTP